MAKHRAIPPMSFGGLVVMAVVGAVAAAVLIAALNPGPKRPVVQAGPSPSASSGVLVSSAPSVPASPVSAESPTPSVSPTASASPTPRVSRSPAPARTTSSPSTFTARYFATTDRNNNGFVTGFEVTNTGSQPATWVVEVTYPSGVVVNSQTVWNASVSRSGNVYRFRANSGAALAAGQSVQFGYMAGAPRGASRPSRCTVNGHTCE